MADERAGGRSISDLIPLLFVVDALLLAAHLAFGKSSTWNLDREHNVPTWFAGAQLGFIALAALQCFQGERSRLARAFPPPFAWALAAAFFFYLSLDETTVIHERFLRNELRDLLPPESLWISLLPWQLVFGPFLLVAALVLLALFASRFARSPSLVRPALVGLACWAGAVLAEALAKPIFMAKGAYTAEVAIEETLELAGATLFLVSFTRYSRMLSGGVLPDVELPFDLRRFGTWAVALVAFLGVATAVVAAASLRNSSWLYRHNAAQLAKRGKHAEAVAAYGEALARQPDDVDSLRGLARAHAKRNDHASALVALEGALALRTADGRLWNAKGVALHELGRYAEAEAAYRKAIAASPRYARALGNLGLALEKQGRREEAIVEYRHALAIEPRQRLATERLRRLEEER